MVPNNSDKLYLDPIEELDDTLEHVWRVLCHYYDTGGEVPSVPLLFYGADVAIPEQAAETVIANMLTDLVECIGRFSPWYTKPARAFGLSTIRDTRTKCIRWVLAPEAIQKWEELIVALAAAIQRNCGLIQAMLYVESLMMVTPYQDECMTASCCCLPSHTIMVNRSVLEKVEIYCNVCKQPFA